MFIDIGSVVIVSAGRWAGRVGLVQKIRLEDEGKQVFVFVAVKIDDENKWELSLFDWAELKRPRGLSREQHAAQNRELWREFNDSQLQDFLLKREA